MKAVPLIQKADVQSINTSIIALKEAQKELETLNIQVNRKISDLNKLLDGLDVDEIGGSGKLVQSIRQTDGKIIATSVDLTSTIASGNNQPVTSGGVASEIIKKESGIIATDTDLNNYLTCGLYVSNGDSLYTNAPVSMYFGLWVIRTAGYQQEVGYEPYRNQILFDYVTGDIYTRSHYWNSDIQGMSWSSWQKVTILKKETITGTTNANGVLYKDNSTLSGSEILIGAARTDIVDCICLIGWGGANGYWIKVCNYDLTTEANTAVTIDVYYL